MSTAAAVPETWELSGDDAWEMLTTIGRLRLAADAFRRFRAADGTSHARSMAFLSIMIVIQGVVVVLGLASAIGQGNLTNLIVRTLQSAAPGPAGKLLTQAVDQAHQAGASDRSTALILGLVAVLVSGTILMGQLERGLNRIYGIEQDRSTVSKYLHAFVLTITAGLLIAAAFIALGVGRSVTGSLGSKTSVQVWDVIRWPLGLVQAIAANALLYRWAPRRRQPAWSWLGFGSFVAVGVWTLSTIALSWFFRFSSSFGQTYGPLAGIIALGIWAFLASVGVLYGGAVVAQLEAVRAGAPAPRDGEVSRREVGAATAAV
jgi:YihY family inner membrane protein